MLHKRKEMRRKIKRIRKKNKKKAGGVKFNVDYHYLEEIDDLFLPEDLDRLPRDKFKKKYFFNPKKIKEGIKGNISYKKINQNKKLNEITKIKRNSVSNHINIKNGMKFIRNNSDFFYGVKGSNSLKNKYRKFELPSIKNKLNKSKNDNAKNTNDLTSN